MGYRESRDFYSSFKSEFHLDRWERFMADRYCYDRFGRKRSDLEPEFSPEWFNEITQGIIDAGTSKLPHNQLVSTLKRCYESVKYEIGQRVVIWEDEKKRGVTFHHSLARSHLGIALLLKVRARGYMSKPSLCNASDEDLLAIPGIDTAGLKQIRAVCPRRTFLVDQAKAKRALQPALFRI